jgi:hypothetical protein
MAWMMAWQRPIIRIIGYPVKYEMDEKTLHTVGLKFPSGSLLLVSP